jgi:hypothetical protein
MNERIQELAVQAHAKGNTLHYYNPEFIEKFTELIVEECGEVAYKAYWDNPETVRGIHIQEKIKQHFGVEE